MCSRSREVRSRSRTSSSVSRDVSSVSEPSAVRTRSVSPSLRAPALTEIFRALLEADFTVQLRNNRALLLSFALPLVLLYALFASFAVKRGIIVGDPQFKVAAALTLGMATIAILGYAMTVARDRQKGIFQRLRVTPAPTWTIIGTTFELISRWSPGGTVETLLSGAMNPSSWNSDTWLALAVSTAYSVVFAGIGIRWFQWGAR